MRAKKTLAAILSATALLSRVSSWKQRLESSLNAVADLAQASPRGWRSSMILASHALLSPSTAPY